MKSFLKNHILLFIIGLGLAMSLGFGIHKQVRKLEAEHKEAQKLMVEVEKLRKAVKDQEELVQKRTQRKNDLKAMEEHIIRSIQISGAKLTDVQTSIVVPVLTTVAMNQLDTFEQRELWIAIIANESKFNVKAKSPVGAVGIGQIMPKSGEWYGKQCDMHDITEQDLYDVRINAMLSACIFKVILKHTNGSAVRALIAYNAGQFSKDLTRIEQLTNINQESANYIAKIQRFLEKTRDYSLLTE